MSSIRCWNIKNIFEYANESALTIFDKHSFAICHEENLYDLKWTKEKNNFIFQFKHKRRFRQRVIHLTFSQHKEKKNIKQIAKINRKLSEKQKYHINH